MKRLTGAALSVISALITLLSVSCGSAREDILFNTKLSGAWEIGAFLYISIYPHRFMLDTSTGETFFIQRDPFENSMDKTDSINVVYCDDTSVYYVSGFKKSIQRIDTRDFSQRTIAQLSPKGINRDLFLSEILSKDFVSAPGITGFFIWNSDIYIQTREGVSIVNPKDGSTNAVFEEHIRTLSFDGKHFYYTNDAQQLWRYSLEDKECVPLITSRVEWFCLKSGTLFYTVAGTEGVYVQKPGENAAVVPVRQKAVDADENGEWIYFISKEDDRLYRIGRDGTNEVPVSEHPVDTFSVTGSYIVAGIKNQDGIDISYSSLDGSNAKVVSGLE